MLVAWNIQNWALHPSLWTPKAADSPAIELSPTDSVVTPNTGAGIFAHQRIPARIRTGGFAELGELATRRAKRAARSIRKTPQDSQPKWAQTVRNCARSHERNYSWKKFADRALASTTINKAREVRGNASRVARRVISWRAIRSEGRGSGGFPWINPWTPHKSPTVSLLFSPIYIFACRWALIHSRSARRDVIPCPI